MTATNGSNRVTGCRASRRRFWTCQRGAELIEFALVFPTLLLVVGGIIDLGFLFQRYEVLTNAAREGARVAVLPDYQANVVGNVTARVNQYLTAAGLTDPATVTVSDPVLVATGTQCISVRTVTVAYNTTLYIIGPVFSLMGGGSTRTIHATSAMRQELAATGC
jgi:Flp pilus assembly protein TadG